MAHIRAVGEVIGTVLAGEQLEQIRGFVRGSAGGIKFDLVRLKPAQHLTDTLESVVPFHWLEGITCPVIAQGMGQTTVTFQLKVRFSQQRGHAVFGEKIRGDAFIGGFPGDGFRPVLTELERGFVFFIGPRTAGQSKPSGWFVRSRVAGASSVSIWVRTAMAVAFNAPQPPAGPS